MEQSPQVDPRVQQALDSLDIVHTVIACDPKLADTAAFCEHYGYKPEQSANTILVASRKVDPVRYCACVVLATSRLDVNKKVCQLLGVKRASFASAEQTVEQTGMMIGGVVAIGLPKDVPVYIDAEVMKLDEIIMGGGNRSSKLILKPDELKKLPNAQVVTGLTLI